MLNKKFFYQLFRYTKNNNQKIIMYNAYENIGIKDGIKNTISEIDQKIAENSKALFEAQIVKLRSTFSNSNNFIQRISKDVYKIKLEDSINWHQKQLKNLYFERRQL